MTDNTDNHVADVVAKIKEGHVEYYEELWNSIEKFIRLRADQYARKVHCSLDLIDDMMQEAFLILPDAIEYYAADCGKSFLGILSDWFLPNAFTKAVYGGRSEAAIHRPLNNYISLDSRIRNSNGETADVKLIDMLIDTSSGADFEAVDVRSFWKSVGDCIRKGIKTLPKRDQRVLFFWLLDNNATITDAYHQQITGQKPKAWYDNTFQSGCRDLRRWMRGKGREDAVKTGIDMIFDIHPSMFYASNISNYRNHCFTSNVEMLATKYL